MTDTVNWELKDFEVVNPKAVMKKPHNNNITARKPNKFAGIGGMYAAWKENKMIRRMKSFEKEGL